MHCDRDSDLPFLDEKGDLTSRNNSTSALSSRTSGPIPLIPEFLQNHPPPPRIHAGRKGSEGSMESVPPRERVRRNQEVLAAAKRIRETFAAAGAVQGQHRSQEQRHLKLP